MMNNDHDPGTPSRGLSERNNNILLDCLGPKRAHDYAETTAKMLSTLGKEELVEWIESTLKLGIHNARQLVDDLNLLSSALNIHSDMNLRGEVLQHAKDPNNTGMTSTSGATKFISTPREPAQSLMASSHSSSPLGCDGISNRTGTNHPLYDSHVPDLLADTGMVPPDKRVPCTRCGKTFKITKMKRFYYAHLRLHHEIPNDEAKVETESEYNRAVQDFFAIDAGSGYHRSGYPEVPRLVLPMEQSQHTTSQRTLVAGAGHQFEAATSDRSSPGTGGLQIPLSMKGYSGFKRARVELAVSPPQLYGEQTFDGYLPLANRFSTGLDTTHSSRLGIDYLPVSNVAQQSMWAYEARQPGFSSRIPKTDDTVDVGYPSSFAEGGVSDSEGATNSSGYTDVRQSHDEVPSPEHRY